MCFLSLQVLSSFLRSSQGPSCWVQGPAFTLHPLEQAKGGFLAYVGWSTMQASPRGMPWSSHCAAYIVLVASDVALVASAQGRQTGAHEPGAPAQSLQLAPPEQPHPHQSKMGPR